MKVELLDHMGSDLSVVNAARVSFDKESEWVYIDNVGHECTWLEGDPVNQRDLREADKRLIHYLVEHDHWSPFSHVITKFRVTAPIIINHQLWKSHIGAATQDDICGWNGVSRRYVASKPKFFTPVIWRKQAENVKQGSSDEQLYGYEVFENERKVWSTPALEYAEWIELAEKKYQEAIDGGMCPEQARFFLPHSMMTEWIWTGSLAFWARLYKLRMHETAQEECKPIASAIGDHMKKLFPVSWSALVE